LINSHNIIRKITIITSGLALENLYIGTLHDLPKAMLQVSVKGKEVDQNWPLGLLFRFH